ncbi:phosphopantetheine-binding protein [Accumulibacter sp.]|uniref:phosphopantetheine-binding protein n=1 Tax=Accumulibacter sp. TaxID=2053492 RepID=UPI0025EC8211|nr:phosphopantetheine-binding protein [Accumulibacter sp.]MCM8614090.1 phosphopantetheine-binding protein [Accumulibacter sp.]MCM8637886.1 phosphopantetheine-binding protein [Accumulibacter sp.]MCM8641293.1 phosphopantetheine-binding protein [Accumulibacter sp.]
MDTLEQDIKILIIEVLNLEDISGEDIASDMPLFGEGLGLDSIDALELGIAMKKTYGIELEAGDGRIREHFRNVLSLAALVRHQGKGSLTHTP